MFPVSRTPFVTALRLIETLEGGGGRLWGSCGLGRMHCSPHKTRKAPAIQRELSLASEPRGLAFLPHVGEGRGGRRPDVTLYSALALVSCGGSRRGSVPYVARSLLCRAWILLGGCSSVIHTVQVDMKEPNRRVAGLLGGAAWIYST